MGKTLRVLNVEDSEHDVTLLARHLQRAGYDLISDRVETAATMKAALESRDWDVILCDYSMPQFNALAALALVKEAKLDIPFIIISGTVGEALAVEAMRSGAHDYLMKDNLVYLGPAIERALQETNRILEATLSELSATTQQLWQASKLATMGELSASIAHELNNPLATVGLRAETLLLQMPEGDPSRRSLETITQEVDRMASLVDNLLNF